MVNYPNNPTLGQRFTLPSGVVMECVQSGQTPRWRGVTDSTAGEDHNELTGREADNCHPISSISLLPEALANKAALLHGHGISDLPEVSAALANKENVGVAASLIADKSSKDKLLATIRSKATYIADFVNNEYKVWESPYGLEPKMLQQALTTSRASDGTVNTPFGVQTRGANVARIEFDPWTNLPLGLLIEEQRTNLLLHRGDFTQPVWGKTNVVPSGTTGNTITDNDTNAQHYVIQNISIPSVQPVTITADVTIGTITRFGFYIHQVGSTANRAIAEIDMATGLVTGVNSVGTYSAVSAFATPNGKGGWLFTITFTPNTENITVRLNLLDMGALINSPVYAGTGKSMTISRVWQELGAFRTSDIPTGASAVPRLAAYTSRQLVRNQSGCIYIRLKAPPILPVSGATVVSFGGGGGANNEAARLLVVGSNWRLELRSAAAVLNSFGYPFTPNEELIVIINYGNVNGRLGFINGVTANSIQNYSVLGDTLTIGHRIATTNNNPYTGTIYEVAHLPLLLSDAEGILVTTEGL